jgi:hypothetical protein
MVPIAILYFILAIGLLREALNPVPDPNARVTVLSLYSYLPENAKEMYLASVGFTTTKLFAGACLHRYFPTHNSYYIHPFFNKERTLHTIGYLVTPLLYSFLSFAHLNSNAPSVQEVKSYWKIAAELLLVEGLLYGLSQHEALRAWGRKISIKEGNPEMSEQLYYELTTTARFLARNGASYLAYKYYLANTDDMIFFPVGAYFTLNDVIVAGNRLWETVDKLL